MVYYHRVGTKQEQDILVLKDAEHPEWMFGAGGTEEWVQRQISTGLES